MKYFLLIWNLLIFSTIPIGLGIGYVVDVYGQEAAETMNESFSGVSGGLRDILDFFDNADKFFVNLGCYIQGTFLGWENVTCVIIE